MLGLKTVPQGERVMVLHTNGKVNYVDGPTRLAVFTAKRLILVMVSMAVSLIQRQTLFVFRVK